MADEKRKVRVEERLKIKIGELNRRPDGIRCVFVMFYLCAIRL